MTKTEERKNDHLNICVNENVETGSTWLEHVKLVHYSLPEINFNEVDTSTEFLGKKFSMPLMITAITGGTKRAQEINRKIARVAQDKGIGMGVGSQRIMIEKPGTSETFYVRDIAPDIFLAGNIGVYQIKQYSPEQVLEATDRIEADALCVHLNAAQEVFQPEGDTDFSGCLDALSDLCKAAGIPVIAKEVGNGINRTLAKELVSAGVSAIDTEGVGGTSWILVDSLRGGPDPSQFLDWGIPTAASVMECAAAGVPVIASGGIRTGLDMAKAISLGASLAGFALPALKAVEENRLIDLLDRIGFELKTSMFLTRSRTVSDLARAEKVITGPLLEWAGQRMK